jgi:hypothetical protein
MTHPVLHFMLLGKVQQPAGLTSEAGTLVLLAQIRLRMRLGLQAPSGSQVQLQAQQQRLCPAHEQSSADIGSSSAFPLKAEASRAWAACRRSAKLGSPSVSLDFLVAAGITP